VRYSKFGIPVRAFVQFHGLWVVHRLFILCFQVIALVTIVRLFTPENIIFQIDVGSLHLNALICRAGCRKGVFAVFCTVSAAGKRGYEDAKTSFQQKRG